MSDGHNIRNVAAKAERDLNSYQAKTGAGNSSSSDATGVNSGVEKKFPGSTVQAGDELNTNAGYNRRIDPSEGGDLDDKGRSTTGQDFEGAGGPEDKRAVSGRDRGGDNDNDLDDGNKHGGRPSATGVSKETLQTGEDAVRSNLAGGSRRTNFKGEDYYQPESVPDSIADQGEVPPDSIIQASKNA